MLLLESVRTYMFFAEKCKIINTVRECEIIQREEKDGKHFKIAAYLLTLSPPLLLPYG